MSVVKYRVQDGIAVITIDSPPMNTLSQGVRAGLMEALDQAGQRADVVAVVLTGGGKVFCAGADINELDSPQAFAEPTFQDKVIGAIENLSKPVVAAINGTALGGGLELAMACHYRVAVAGAQLGFPEIRIGLIPGAGGTQRLPRALGLERALEMMLTGNSIPASQAAGSQLIHEVCADDAVDCALRLAGRVADQRPLPRLRDQSVSHPDSTAVILEARKRLSRTPRLSAAGQACIDAVEGSVTVPVDQALRTESELFARLMASPESQALRYLFRGERDAGRVAGITGSTPSRPIRHAAVIGAGTMGGGIAMCFIDAGIPVTLLEVSQKAIDQGLAGIRRNYESAVKRGRLTAAECEERLGRISSTLEYRGIADADIVVEAVFEDIGVKEQVFRKLDEVMKPGAILATNTSSLDVDRIAAATRRPADVVGMHFFSPANIMRLLEVVRGAATSPEVLNSVMKLAKPLRKFAVVSGVCDGFIANRIFGPYLRQSMFLLEEGALPWQIDRALEEWGMAQGPFKVSDGVGNDVIWAVRKRHYVEHPEIRYASIGDELCRLGRFGIKTGGGWYSYENKREPVADPEVETLIIEHSAKRGVPRRAICDAEIVERCVYALINEAAAVLGEGIAQRASDIDCVFANGFGFPANRGGPLHYADSVGLDRVVQAMAIFAANPHADPSFWRPARLLQEHAASGRAFTGGTRS